MQPRSRSANLYLVLALVLFVGVMFLQSYIWPPPTPPKKPRMPDDVVGLYAGALAPGAMDKDVDVFARTAEERQQLFPSNLGNVAGGLTTVALGIDAPALAAAERRKAAARPAEPDE